MMDETCVFLASHIVLGENIGELQYVLSIQYQKVGLVDWNMPFFLVVGTGDVSVAAPNGNECYVFAS